MFLLWAVCEGSDKCLVTFARLCTWKDSYLFAFMFLQLSPFFVCVCAVSGQGWLCQGWRALSKTFCSAFGFSPQGLGGAEQWMKGPKSALEKPLLDHFISALTILPPSHLCATAQRYTQNDVVIYNVPARTGGGGGGKGGLVIVGQKGKKLTSPGPFRYLGKIMSPPRTSVSVKQGNPT